MYDDRDELCECVFCNCVFPTSEAAEILANPDKFEFKNEKIEKQEGAKHYYSSPVLPDIVEKAVKRDVVSKAQTDTAKLKANEFEISPNDVKAPKKLVIGMAVGAFAIVAIIVAIALPLFLSRKTLTEAITADIDTVFAASDKSFDYKQFDIYGLSCQYVKIGVSADLTDEEAKQFYANYSKLRSDKSGNATGDVEMYIYTPDTIFFISKDGFNKNVQEVLEIIETTEESK
jgi:hypothetical protein